MFSLILESYTTQHTVVNTNLENHLIKGTDMRIDNVPEKAFPWSSYQQDKVDFVVIGIKSTTTVYWNRANQLPSTQMRC